MLVFYITLSLCVSFLCSLLEAVILSVSPSYLSSLKSTKPKLYAKVSDLKEDIEKPLASILSFNTVAHTIGAAGAGAEAQKAFGSEVLTIFSILLTLAILFLSEIIPKSIGASSWRSLLPFSVKILKPMIFLSTPLVYISQKLTKMFQGKKEAISREEINALADIGLSDGVLHEDEHRALKGLVTFSKLRLDEVLRPKSVVKGLFVDTPIQEAYNEIQNYPYSRVLIYGINQDDIKGYVMRSDLQKAYIEKETQLKELIKPILIQPQEASVRNLFHRLLKRREHISAVIDDSGSFIGIITLEDLIEKMLGLEIFDEFDL
ncbi:MAG: CNNM domain-containing protein [Bacteriovoracaceae bacterium]|jgi:CBS domain containing-hemolysin-like protein|nr:hemolysin [Halobacteriovoraceae bacterium]MDP7321426.1 CNNM domain-containing protein [Bacteriovoracaceae bacterium]